jgi:hypothetical protein
VTGGEVLRTFDNSSSTGDALGRHRRRREGGRQGIAKEVLEDRRRTATPCCSPTCRTIIPAIQKGVHYNEARHKIDPSGRVAGRCRMTPSPDATPLIDWQEAVARLARERTVAETCAALLKKHGDAAAIARGALAYGEAKAEFDGIIAGLIVALARKAAPTSLPDLETRLRRAFEKREAFCQSIKLLVPAPIAGERGITEDILKGTIGPLIDAIKAIWLRIRDDNALMRKTIETQLEATVWPNFASVAPG